MRLIIPLLFILSFPPGCRNDDKTGITEVYKVERINERKLESIIKDRAGNILFINIWATWCIPCIEEFPDLIRTSEYYRDKNVDIISLNVDSESDIETMVIPFIKKYKTGFPVYNIDEKKSEKIINLLNPEWSGAIPATFIYDEAGKQQVFILGTKDYAGFRNAIDSVLSL